MVPCWYQYVAGLQGRYVTVLRMDGMIYCIDSICFHAGGPLVGLTKVGQQRCDFPRAVPRKQTLHSYRPISPRLLQQGIGDIEDVNGQKCLVCPWHFYRVGSARALSEPSFHQL